MNPDHERGRAVWLILSGVLFLFSCYACYTEAVYLTHGIYALGDITSDYRMPTRSGSRRVIDFTFAEEDGTRRRGKAGVSDGWEVPPERKAWIQYTPGEEGRSRL